MYNSRTFFMNPTQFCFNLNMEKVKFLHHQINNFAQMQHCTALLLCPLARHITLDCTQWFFGSASHGSGFHWCVIWLMRGGCKALLGAFKVLAKALYQRSQNCPNEYTKIPALTTRSTTATAAAHG